MDNCTDCLNHSYGVCILPDVPPKIYPYSTSLHPIINKFQYLKLCFCLWSACYDNRDRTTVHNLIKIFTPVCLYNLCTKFSGDTAAQCKITCITLLQFFTNCCNCHDWNSIFLSLIYKV